MSPSADPPGTAFIRRDAVRAGVPKHRLDGPAFRAVFPAVRVPATVQVTLHLRAESALLLCHESAMVSHHTAARLWGGVVPDDADVHVSVQDRAHRPRRDGIHPHVHKHERRPSRRGRVRLTDPVSTYLDLARELDLVDLVVLGDSLVKAGRCTVGEVQAAAKAWHGPGAKRARHAATLMRADADSPMETRLRLLLIFAGLPEPRVNWCIRNEGGQTIYRIDLAFAEWRVAVEYDGRQHAEDDRQWGHDLGRRESLDALGWRLIVCRATDVYTSPSRTVDRVVSALRAHGMELTDPTPSPLFHRHFPGRPGRQTM